VDQLQQRLQELAEQLKIPGSGPQRTWWDEFLERNAERLPACVRFAEELLAHDAEFAEFFRALLNSDGDSPQGTIHFMLYQRLRKQQHDDFDDSSLLS